MTKLKNSHNSPIGVNFLPCSLPGSVGLTLAPGKHQSSKGGAVRWQRDLETDLDRLVESYRTNVPVCLLQDRGLDRLKIPNLVEEATKRGIRVHRLPIPDGGVLPEQSPVERLVKLIVESAAAGENVVIHCAGGLGRAGTVGGCFLVETGMSAPDAVETLHRCRSHRCPEIREQERFIADYARSRHNVQNSREAFECFSKSPHVKRKRDGAGGNRTLTGVDCKTSRNETLPETLF